MTDWTRNYPTTRRGRVEMLRSQAIEYQDLHMIGVCDKLLAELDEEDAHRLGEDQPAPGGAS